MDKLNTFRVKKTAGKKWLINRVVDEWKKLIRHSDDINIVETFKCGLDKFRDGEGRW